MKRATLQSLKGPLRQHFTWQQQSPSNTLGRKSRFCLKIQFLIKLIKRPMRLPWILTSKLPKIKYQSNYWQKFEFCPSVSRDPRTKRIRFFRHVSAVSRDVSTHYATPFSFVSLLNFCRKRWCGVFLFFLENSQNSWLQLQSRINRKHLWALKIQKGKNN